MPIVEWDVTYILGIQEIDQQHKTMVELLNKSYDEFRAGARIEQSVIEQLIEFSETHFACEERLMAETSYPGLTDHREEHKIFIRRMKEFKKSYKPTADASVEILWFLCNWVTHHIRETDAKFGRFMDIENVSKSIKKMTAQ